MPYMPIPTVIETTNRGEVGYSLFDRLMRDRIIFLGTEIDDHISNIVVGELLFLESQDPDKPISMYINSPGGSVTAGLAIYDTMQYVKCPVATICVGQAASMGAVLLAAGAKGQRSSLPNSRIMIHQPLGGARGQATDMEIQVKEIIRLKARLNEILVKHTGQPMERVEKDTDRDFFMGATEAKAYGLVDEVVVQKKAENNKK